MERLLTVDQVAEWLQVKPRTIYQWVHEGFIPVIKLGSLVRFERGDVLQWIKTRTDHGRPRRRLEMDIN